MLGKGVLVKIIPEDIVLIRVSIIEMIRMDRNSNAGRQSVLHDNLSEITGPVDDNHILLRKV